MYQNYILGKSPYGPKSWAMFTYLGHYGRYGWWAWSCAICIAPVSCAMWSAVCDTLVVQLVVLRCDDFCAERWQTMATDTTDRFTHYTCMWGKNLIGASWSEPHSYHSYEKITVPTYTICMRVPVLGLCAATAVLYNIASSPGLPMFFNITHKKSERPGRFCDIICHDFCHGSLSPPTCPCNHVHVASYGSKDVVAKQSYQESYQQKWLQWESGIDTT